MPIGPFVRARAVRSQHTEGRAFLKRGCPITSCKGRRFVTAGGDGRAALCAAYLVGERSQQGTSGGVSDPPLWLAA
jgi:hypothetical protein